MQFLVGTSLEDVSVDGRIILKGTSKVSYVRMASSCGHGNEHPCREFISLLSDHQLLKRTVIG